ncbi:hypothetical protein Tco_0893559 [Tanacetum coccineum]|uniref:Uncharacterized protein n=1 Tax=Tanacetum coccineum TaxID=301880 RepID=A0ABQ5CBY5_9ASTR
MEIIRIKREQGEEKQDSTYSIRSTDKRHVDGLVKEVAVKGERPLRESRSTKRSKSDSALWVSSTPRKMMDQSSRTRESGKKKLCKADLEGPAFNLVKAFHKNSVFLQYQMDECGQTAKNGPLSISKLKAAHYLDFGLEELVPSLWVESEREYDISAVYGITHWWFRRKELYINKHSEPSDREAFRSQMRILSVISVKDFEFLIQMNFEDLFLLNIPRKAQHCQDSTRQSSHSSQHVDKNLDATDYYFKEDYTIIPKPRAVVYRDRNDQRKLMRLNEYTRHEIGSGQRMKEKKQRLHHCNREKTRSKGHISNSLVFSPHCGNKSIKSLRIILVILPEHPSETMVFHNEDGNPARANVKQALGYLKDGYGDGNSQLLRYQVDNRMLRHDLHLL